MNRTVLLCCLLTISTATFGQLPAGRLSVTHHRGTFHNTDINFAAKVKETILTGQNGKAVASVITTSYTKDDGGQRPVMFVFNGGPGASSSPLHMRAFGPNRIVFNADKSGSIIIPNPMSPLDFTDLVFVDPVGTGYTQILDSVAAESYWEIKKDAQVVVDLIKDWKKENKRNDSPIYICGESYGSFRAAAIMAQLGDLQVSGVMMLAAIVDFGLTAEAPGNEMAYVLHLPSMTCAAWYHHKISRSYKTVKEVYDDAVRFAGEEYLPALVKGASLSEKERMAMAEKLKNYTGLPIKMILDQNLRIKLDDYLLLLLEGDGERIGRLDGRDKGPLKVPGVKPPFDDPSMVAGPPHRPIINTYFENDLKFPSNAQSYNTLNMHANSKWIWHKERELTTYFSLMPMVIDGMLKQPNMKLMVASGYYDMATTLYGSQYSFQHSGLDQKRVTYAPFPTGHGIFENDESLEVLVQSIKKFMSLN